MTLTLLKYNTDLLLEVVQNYESLLQKRVSASPDVASRMDDQLRNLKNQILFLLTAVKKEVEQEKNA